MRAMILFQRRINLASRGGRLAGVLPLSNGQLLPIRGPRNREAHIAAGTKLGIRAAYRSAMRAQAHGEALLHQLRGGK